jgi:beta-lactamase class A
MQGTVTNTLLPAGLEKGAIIAHKTGDIGTTLGDAGIIDMPNGKRYIMAVMVKRPHNDENGRKLIQEISREVYQHFKWSTPNSTHRAKTEPKKE